MSVAHTPALIDALKALQRDSKQVTEDLDRRLASSPPYTPPGDATASPSTPEDGSGEDNVQKFNRLRSEYTASMPRQQFFAQAKRIEERIVHQLKHPRRRETIPHELNTEPRANAQNFLRRNWCTQEIWEHEWGPPWPPGRRGPVYGPIGPGYVGNEWSKAAKVVSKKRGRPRMSAYTEEVYSAASRPLAQFLFQLQLERRWQEDELHYTRQRYTPVDLDAMTYRSLRNIWDEDRLWSSSWKVMPSDSDLWLHERMDFATYATLQEDTEGGLAGQTQNQFGLATSSMSFNAIDPEALRKSSSPSADNQNAERGPRHAGALFDGTPVQVQKIRKKTEDLTKPRRSSRLNPSGSAGGSLRNSVCPEISRINTPKLSKARKARGTRASRRA